MSKAITFDYKAFQEHKKTPRYWGGFKQLTRQHRYILSLLHQLKWTTSRESDGKTVPDLERFGKWLQSDKSPVQKPFRDMVPDDLSTTIGALSSMVGKSYSKNA
ncbi:MAG: hypothetical protein AAF717_00195 [Bacteroidota bacterium]